MKVQAGVTEEVHTGAEEEFQERATQRSRRAGTYRSRGRLVVGVNLLDERKRFHLNKHMTAIRKMLKMKKGKGLKMLRAHK